MIFCRRQSCFVDLHVSEFVAIPNSIDFVSDLLRKLQEADCLDRGAIDFGHLARNRKIIGKICHGSNCQISTLYGQSGKKKACSESLCKRSWKKSNCPQIKTANYSKPQHDRGGHASSTSIKDDGLFDWLELPLRLIRRTEAMESLCRV